MKIDIKEINSFTQEMKITIPWENLKDKYMVEVNNFRNTYKMPGFRPGKVPMHIIKKNFGQEIESHFVEHAINEFYFKALKENKLDPINQAKIDNLKFAEEKDMEFTATFEVQPEIIVPKYDKKFKIKATRYTPSDNDIDLTLKDYQERFSTAELIETGAETDHLIMGDFQLLDDDKNPIEDKKFENRYIKIGEGLYGGDVQKALIGAKTDDKINISVDMKEGETSHYEILVKKVEKQVLPELTDEFAKSVDPKVETMDELRKKILVDISASLDQEYEKTVRHELSDFFVKNSKTEVPPSMQENYIQNMIEHLKKQQHQHEPLDEAQVREAYAESAIWNVKWYLLREKLISAEKIIVLKKDITEKIKEVTNANPEQKKQIKEYYATKENENKLSEDILDEKLFDRLKELATIKEVKKTTADLQKSK